MSSVSFTRENEQKVSRDFSLLHFAPLYLTTVNLLATLLSGLVEGRCTDNKAAALGSVLQMTRFGQNYTYKYMA
jgi:hypothetical protein